jgi:hypothetical protein
VTTTRSVQTVRINWAGSTSHSRVERERERMRENERECEGSTVHVRNQSVSQLCPLLRLVRHRVCMTHFRSPRLYRVGDAYTARAGVRVEAAVTVASYATKSRPAEPFTPYREREGRDWLGPYPCVRRRKCVHRIRF